MTIAIANVELTNTFDQWRTRTNQLAEALSIKVVTVDSNAAVGNAAIVGAFTANAIYTDTLYGGTTGAPAPLTIGSNAAFSATVDLQANVTFSSDPSVVNDLGTQTNLRIAGANTTHKYLVGYSNNGVGYETLIDVLTLSDLADMNVESFGTTNTVANSVITANGSILQYDTLAAKWHVGRFPFNIAANGNVGLNATPDATKFNLGGTLKVSGNTTLGANLLVTDTATTRVGINKASPQTTLHIGGSVYIDGDWTANYTSDINFKHSVYSITPESGETLVRLLRPVSFLWDQEAVAKNPLVGPKPDHMDVGFIAQEVQRLVPQAVITREDGTLGISYERLIPLIVAAVQDLQQRVTRVENGNG